MLHRALNRSRKNGGFTMIELLIVLIVLGILIAIALPGYLSFRARANRGAAQANIHNAEGPLVYWNGSHTDGYASVTALKLKQSYNVNVSLFWPTTTGYCLKSKVGTEVWYQGGPSTPVTSVKPGPGVICP